MEALQLTIDAPVADISFADLYHQQVVKDGTHTLSTRNAGPPRVGMWDIKSDRPIQGVILMEDGTESPRTWLANGRYDASGKVHKYDLVLVPKPPKSYGVLVVIEINGVDVLKRRDTLQEIESQYPRENYNWLAGPFHLLAGKSC